MGRLLRIALAAGLLAAGAAQAQEPPTPDRAELLQRHSGGVMRIVSISGPGTLDVHIGYLLRAYQLFAFTYDGLLTFRKKDGAASEQVVPDLAEAMPQVSDGGKTYVFRLRRGVRFSDGSEVAVHDVVASYQRMFKVSGPEVGGWYSVIVGAAACLRAPASCTLEGGVSGDEAARTVTFHLTAPDAEFAYKVAFPLASVVPADSPPRDMGTQPLAGTGAYAFKSVDPNNAVVMVRNPYFHEWSEDAQPAGFPDEIDYTFGLNGEAQVTAILNGQADWMYDDVPLDRLAELGGKHQDLVHINPLLAYTYLSLNNRIPPFDNEKARLAVSYAADRRAAVSLFGGARLATPTCQMLPPGIDGYEPYCPYTVDPGAEWKKPDLAKARRLMQESGMIGQPVTVITSDTSKERALGAYLQSLLASLGFQASVRSLSAGIDFTYMQNTNNKVQAGIGDWLADYPAPSDFLHTMFSCASFHPGSDASVNTSGYCDETTEAMMDDAMAAEVSDPQAAPAKWAAIDRRLTDQAPIVTLYQEKRLDLVSPRVGGYQFSAVYYMLLSQAWVM